MLRDEEFLMISGIQHFLFCKRQWMLIHVEQQWQENVHTVRGEEVHSKVDDPFIIEKRNGVILSRAMGLRSEKLGFYGVADMIEFHESSEGCTIKNREGLYKVLPIEYKAGKPKIEDCDRIQLCVQAMCLEEMLNTSITEGAIYYFKIRHREGIRFDQELRNKVLTISDEMRKIFIQRETIVPVYSKMCDSCSLYNICLPKTIEKMGNAQYYVNNNLFESTGDES